MKKYFIALLFLLGVKGLQAQEPVTRNNNQPAKVNPDIPKTVELQLLKAEIDKLFSNLQNNIFEMNKSSALLKQKIEEYNKKKGVLSFELKDLMSQYDQAETLMSSLSKKMEDLLKALKSKMN